MTSFFNSNSHIRVSSFNSFAMSLIEKSFVVAFLFMLVFVTLTISGHLTGVMASGILQVHVLDVWQGDCILLITPSGKTMLVDAGEADYGSRVLSYLKKHGIKNLDVALLTHPHSDHMGGFLTVLKKMKTELVYDSTSYYTQTYKKYLEIIKEKNIPMRSAVRGDVINLDPEVKIKVLSPVSVRKYEGRPPSLTPQNLRSEINDRSIVIRVDYGSTSIVLSADAENMVETTLVSQGLAKKCDVLKVGHHGSRTSSAKTFLKKLHPQTAVISVGKGNSFNHPAEITMTNLENMKIEILRTDWHGDIILNSDGAAWTRMKKKSSSEVSSASLTIGGSDVVEALCQDIIQDLEFGDTYGFQWLKRTLANNSESRWGELGTLSSIIAQRLRLSALSDEQSNADYLKTLDSLLGNKTGNGLGGDK